MNRINLKEIIFQKNEHMDRVNGTDIVLIF